MEELYGNVEYDKSEVSWRPLTPHTGPSRSESRSHGAAVVFLVLSVFLLVGLVGLGVHYHNLSTVKDHLTERLRASEANLTERLRASEANLTERLQTTEANLTERLRASEDHLTERLRASEANLTERLRASEEHLTERLRASEANLTERLQTIEDHLTERLRASEEHLTERLRASEANLTERLQTTEANLTERLRASEDHLTERLQASEEHLTERLRASEANLTERLRASEANLTERLRASEDLLTSMSEERELLNSSLTQLTEDMDRLQRWSKLSKTCPAGWTTLSSSCYFVSSSSASWEKSREDCRDKGADLVIIDSLEEQKFLSNIIKHHTWIGLNDKDHEGNWKWIDGTPLTQPAYWNSPPDNGGGDPQWGEEDCAEMLHWREAEVSWNDVGCNNSKRWICEHLA
ncbi:CD209 antigen-like [Cyclopterus lumpus]|uniref:CD209 antigen-like n=1 Tax=Cyclopterus lumpus TaxID=8103 RepID=UPI001485D1B8|nr:CD209 antigen-like [Cyclopterus lumpus]